MAQMDGAGGWMCVDNWWGERPHCCCSTGKMWEKNGERKEDGPHAGHGGLAAVAMAG